MTRDTHIQTIDLALRSIAKRRAALDAEEARWLREAEAAHIWQPLGMVSMLDYLERALGYTPRVALERLRVARALAELPVLTGALAAGALPFSALRELTRVVVPATEAEWCSDAIGKNLREIEELVATHKRGDRPSDPGDPDLRPRVLRFEVSPATFVRLREARAALDAERGERLDDDRFVAALCGLALDEASTAGAEPNGRAKFQLATIICARCDQGWQTGGGATVAVPPAEVARARCDAQHIGSLDAETPVRAAQDISPKVRRFVWRRDRGRCVLPGCRSGRNLELHHLVARADGGTHHASNLAVLCDSHHAAHHAGTLAISGTAPDAIVFARPPMRPPAGEARGRRLGVATLRVDAKSALVNMGWKAHVASAAVDEALARIGGGASASAGAEIAEVIREALRRCPRPAAAT